MSFAVALMMLMSLAAEVRALALPDCTSFPNWNSALAAAGATVPEISPRPLFTIFNVDNGLQSIQYGALGSQLDQGHDPANLNGYLAPAA